MAEQLPGGSTVYVVRRGSLRRRRRRRWGRILLLLGVGVAVLLGGGVVAGNLVADHYAAAIRRQDILAHVPASERAQDAPVTGPLDILLLGSDNAAGARGKEGVTGQRSDSMMLIHVGRAFRRVVVVSIQRDAYVDIPAVPGRWPGGKAKINQALDLGGPALSIRTVQNLLGIKIDHVVVVGFDALRKVTDAVGGVDVHIDSAIYDPRFPRQTWTVGWHHLDGRRAEAYVRQRYGLPGSDYDRIKRQQQYLHALTAKASSLGVLSSPSRLDALFTAITSSLTVDTTMPVKGLAFAARGLDSGNVTFATMPMSGLLRVGGVDYEQVDADAARALGQAVNTDDFGPYFAAYPPNDATHGY
ncbi:MAG TPA: LCP family protein [Mycobacteriales bacterium]|jgi:LCP family protein required for cell wall assembly|nr:LCP family protein [Mycobacteriales bacterium]